MRFEAIVSLLAVTVCASCNRSPKRQPTLPAVETSAKTDIPPPTPPESDFLVCARGIDPLTGVTSDSLMERVRDDLDAHRKRGTTSSRESCNGVQAMLSRGVRGLVGLELDGKPTNGVWDFHTALWGGHVQGCRMTVPTWEQRASADYHAIVVGFATGQLADALPYLVDLEAYFSDDPWTAFAESCFEEAVVAEARKKRPQDGFNALTATVPKSGIPECDALHEGTVCIKKSMLRGDHDDLKVYMAELEEFVSNTEDPEERRAWCVKQVAERTANMRASYDCGSVDPSPGASPR